MLGWRLGQIWCLVPCPCPVLPLLVTRSQLHQFRIHPAQVPWEEQELPLVLCSLPWVLDPAPNLLQEEVGAKGLGLGLGSPWGCPRTWMEQLEPLVEERELCCTLHLPPHLPRDLLQPGRAVELPREQEVLELL